MAERKINGATYRVGTVLATDALRLKLRLLKVVGAGVDQLPAILAGAGGKATPAVKKRSDQAAIAAFTEIFMKSDVEEMITLVKDIVEIAQIKRPSGYDQVDLDGDFSGKTGDMLAVAVFVLQEIFGGFFGEVLATGSRAKRAAG